MKLRLYLRPVVFFVHHYRVTSLLVLALAVVEIILSKVVS